MFHSRCVFVWFGSGQSKWKKNRATSRQIQKAICGLCVFYLVLSVQLNYYNVFEFRPNPYCVVLCGPARKMWQVRIQQFFTNNFFFLILYLALMRNAKIHELICCFFEKAPKCVTLLAESMAFFMTKWFHIQFIMYFNRSSGKFTTAILRSVQSSIFRSVRCETVSNAK